MPDEPKKVAWESLAKIILPREISSNLPDEQTQEEQEDLEKQRKKTEIKGLDQDIDERKKYARCFFGLACAWIAIIAILLFLQGFGSFWWGRMPFKLTEPVILATIGATTVNILGILYVVANYLFPKR